MNDLQLKDLVERLIRIGAALSSERDLATLLELIVSESRRFTNSDGGTLFLVDEDASELRWAIVQNETMDVSIGGPGGQPLDSATFRPIALDSSTHSSTGNVAAYVARSGEAVHIEDVYDETDDWDFTGPRDFDARTGYRTRSMLVVPLKHFEGGVVGVLQLINARDPGGASTSFSPLFQELTTSLASQAAVAVKNARLFEELEAQFEAFIRTIAAAIDEKSAYTAGHVRRVVDIAMRIARAIDRDDSGPFSHVHFDDNELKALHIASWMHDIGKIATPEYVVDKATKLETIYDRVHTVRTRYQILKKDAEIDRLRAVHADPARRAQADAELQRTLDELDDEFAFIESCNMGGEYMADDRIARLEEIAQHTYEVDGVLHPRLTEDEVYNLSIRKGTLTGEEIQVIRNHAAISYKMLSELPFSRHLADVPEIAAGHHEKLNGKGYPRGLTADQLSTPARILAVADIFEALTAADRPYKRPTPLSRVHRILTAMVADGELDPDIVDFAMASGVFDDYAHAEVSPEQRDLVFREVGSKEAS